MDLQDIAEETFKINRLLEELQKQNNMNSLPKVGKKLEFDIASSDASTVSTSLAFAILLYYCHV
jgi:hypothetical protein